MGFDHDGAATRAGNQILRWGSAGKLRRGVVLRDCIVGIIEYNPRANRILNLDGAERALIAAPLAIPPHHDFDVLIANGNLYRIVLPVKGPRPGGIVIYYDLDILYDSVYAA